MSQWRASSARYRDDTHLEDFSRKTLSVAGAFNYFKTRFSAGASLSPSQASGSEDESESYYPNSDLSSESSRIRKKKALLKVSEGKPSSNGSTENESVLTRSANVSVANGSAVNRSANVSVANGSAVNRSANVSIANGSAVNRSANVSVANGSAVNRSANVSVANGSAVNRSANVSVANGSVVNRSANASVANGSAVNRSTNASVANGSAVNRSANASIANGSIVKEINDLNKNNSTKPFKFDIMGSEGKPKYFPDIQKAKERNYTKTPHKTVEVNQEEVQEVESVPCPNMANYDDDYIYDDYEEMQSTANILLTSMSDPVETTMYNKVTILGCGACAMACVLALFTQRITNEVVIFDTDESKAMAEVLDIQSASVYLNSARVFASTDIEDTANSKVIIITPEYGGMTSEEEFDPNTAGPSINILKAIIPHIVPRSPNCIIINAAYPCDIMTYVAWRLARTVMPDLESYRVIGLGTAVSSARLRMLISLELGIASSSCKALVVGEPGRESVPIWTSVTAGGVRIQDINKKAGYEDDPETWYELGNDASSIETHVRKLRPGGTLVWSSAVILAQLTKAIVQNTLECFTVSTHVRGCRHGNDKDVFMSLPCIIGSNGVTQVAKQPLGDFEKDVLQSSAAYFYDMIQHCFE